MQKIYADCMLKETLADEWKETLADD